MKTNEDNERTFKVGLDMTRSFLIQTIKNHEATEYNVMACFAEREKAIAFLAHCLGLEPPNLDSIKQQLDEYNRECKILHDDRGLHVVRSEQRS